MNNTLLKLAAGTTLALGSIMISATATAQKVDPAVQAVMDRSFREQGIAKLDRIQQDEIQALCSDEKFRDSPEGKKKAEALQAAALAAIKPPSDGKYLGNWATGEKIAQSGRGATWTDSLKTVNGGGCYNCHQVSKQEISHGTIGPSLLGYGKTRGNSDVILTYTWNRISNSKAYNACSNMPRMQHFNLLTEQQIKDVMALLLDPASPVNQ
ncbi:sulfur oxidation c-type cytochrome SoxX [Alcaligenaceae bacterium LF4-65]|uniref:Sulfur oxidation c-type cytochrome SoxX n=1 Tax=Zwartia hollandica TaxID=324606 RepID=A0A953T4J7_9BURK|nr:sulfur oxidation c-type cytochrome SoxX [Zwartia hollandica]MBZ1349912.1 sulfur oxidation c-type cytochrome SoxX [Zwartia hollandica]